MKQNVTAVLCGDLNMLRCFTGLGIPTFVVSSNPDDFTFHSRYCHQKRVIADPQIEPDKTVQDLVELGQMFRERPVLLYSNDTMLLLISRNREFLGKYYRFLLPERDLIENLVDKTRFASLADSLGFPVPKTILSRQIRAAEEAKEYISLPCILKPNFHIGWFESRLILEEGGKPQKVLRANNFDELNDRYNKMKQFTDDFIIQEYIPGGADSIYSFHAYFDRHSEALAYYVGRKIRTYPKDSGKSTYLELVKEPEVVRLGVDILNRLKFVGSAKIDFKKDVETNRFYVLEINPRFTLWNYLGAVCGVNLPYVAYLDLVGETCKPQKDYRTGIKWLSFGNDLRAFIRDYRRNGDLSWGRWLRSYGSQKIYDTFSWRDPYPFVLLLLNYSKALFRRLAKGAVE